MLTVGVDSKSLFELTRWKNFQGQKKSSEMEKMGTKKKLVWTDRFYSVR